MCSSDLFAGATASDIRDKDSDQAAGVITFPVAYGIANTIAGIQVLNLLSILWVLLAIQLHWLPLPALALLVSNGLGLRAWNRLRRGRTSCRAVLLLAYLETLTMPLLVAIGALIAHLAA